ncbi:feather keratin 2-like [Sceloporus undulatus]|uniref:feather keratin 2-like n=1 Tax=Sceloporus undulatus TaxID=8520 RepID=UPI001C4D3237|nr:feather keratin 2-like [Sceloporus undulatus]
MPGCGPVCAIPSCASETTVGFGSRGLGGYGNQVYGGFGYGGFGGLGFGGSELASNLGVLNGIIPSCINQVPSSEVLIQPAPVVVTIPGAILSATCEPVAVGGNAPCAVSGIGLAGGLGHRGFGYGIGNRGFGLSRHGYLGYGRRGSICT